MFSGHSWGQISLAHTFPGFLPWQSEVVNLSISGKKIAVIRGQYSYSNLPDTIFYYNTDYSLWKTIIFPTFPGLCGNYRFVSTGDIPISYSSETLFNLDTLLEVAVFYWDSANIQNSKILIVNENNLIVDSMLNVDGVFFDVHSISPTTFVADVMSIDGLRYYNLPGTIPCDICGGGLGLAKTDEKPTNFLSNPMPNPSKDQVKITFTLPDGANRGELTIYNTSGQIMKSYTVDNRFGFIMVDDSQFAPGLYYYNLVVNGVLSSTQKMVVVK